MSEWDVEFDPDDYNSAGYTQSFDPSTRFAPSYASSDRFTCSRDFGDNLSFGGFISHDSGRGGSGYGAGLTLGFRF